MNAAELFKESGDPVGVFFCGKCGTVGWDKAAAERCCVPHTCKTCGKEEEASECRECFNARETEKEQERLEKAEKVTEWDGWVYTDGLGYKEGYFESVGDLLDYLADQPDAAPDYVWTCDERAFVSIDEDAIYEQIENDGYEDFERGSLNGTDELEAALRAFEKANESVFSYLPDYSKALILTPDLEQEAKTNPTQ